MRMDVLLWTHGTAVLCSRDLTTFAVRVWMCDVLETHTFHIACLCGSHSGAAPRSTGRATRCKKRRQGKIRITRTTVFCEQPPLPPPTLHPAPPPKPPSLHCAPWHQLQCVPSWWHRGKTMRAVLSASFPPHNHVARSLLNDLRLPFDSE
jgi:hypothetical protein